MTQQQIPTPADFGWPGRNLNDIRSEDGVIAWRLNQTTLAQPQNGTNFPYYKGEQLPTETRDQFNHRKWQERQDALAKQNSEEAKATSKAQSEKQIVHELATMNNSAFIKDEQGNITDSFNYDPAPLSRQMISVLEHFERLDGGGE